MEVIPNILPFAQSFCQVYNILRDKQTYDLNILASVREPMSRIFYFYY